MIDSVDNVPGGYSWDAVMKRMAIIRQLARKKRELVASVRKQRSSFRGKYREAEEARRRLHRLKNQIKAGIDEIV